MINIGATMGRSNLGLFLIFYKMYFNIKDLSVRSGGEGYPR
jgi:hypothetical protein